MDWVETTGRTVEEAKQLALEQLGVDESDAEFEVVAEAKIGLFGRLKEEARVRARVQPRFPRSKGERRDRRRSRAKAESSSGTPSQATAPALEPSPVASAPAPKKRAKPDDNQSPRPSQTAPRRRRKTGGAGNTVDKPEPQPNMADAQTSSPEDLANTAESFLKGLLKELDAPATVSSKLGPEAIDISIDGGDLGTLIGPRGATLVALQELTRIVLQRHALPPDCRLTVDVNSYRKRRHEALARFAQQVAAEVAASNKKRALEPMPPADRKVVHDAVNSVAGVTTISEGEEPYRRVVLVPIEVAKADQPDLQGATP
ncbi:MAG TPA: RNA-binding cell elongation regulator Jag/EloR [Acidimicrobiales bacterium]|nr:RNA-binding cell elongation regulator Jag/EloR [Acidimicrobiales bacterium]